MYLESYIYSSDFLPRCPNVNNKGFADIGRAVKRLPSLETLDLRFNE